MTNERTNREQILRLTYLAALTALVVILQLAGSFIRLGMFSISAVLVPIVLGAAICGRMAGAWLGFVFGVTVLLSGDASAFLAVNPFGTVVTVLLKGALCGLVAGVVYRLVADIGKSERVAGNRARATMVKYGAVLLAAIVCPLVNTGVFLLGTFVFFWDTASAWAGSDVFMDVIYFLIGFNWVFEIILNVVLVPVIIRLLGLVKIKSI